LQIIDKLLQFTTKATQAIQIENRVYISDFLTSVKFMDRSVKRLSKFYNFSLGSNIKDTFGGFSAQRAPTLAGGEEEREQQQKIGLTSAAQIIASKRI